MTAQDAFTRSDVTLANWRQHPFSQWSFQNVGEFVPTEKFAEAAALVRRADALLIAGSSLAVNSGIRLLDQAAKRRIPIVIINRGVTKGDSRASLKIDAGTSEVLSALSERLTD